jgi:hypothetical protein
MTIGPRAHYIAGLRQLADLLDANPDAALPYGTGTGTHPAARVPWFFERLSDFRAFIDAFPSALTRDEAESDAARRYPHVFFGELAGLRVGVYCSPVLDDQVDDQVGGEESRPGSGAGVRVDAAARA